MTQPGYQAGGEPMWWWKVALHLDEAQLALANAMAHNLEDQRPVFALQDRLREGTAILLEIFRVKGLVPAAVNGKAEIPPPPPDAAAAMKALEVVAAFQAVEAAAVGQMAEVAAAFQAVEAAAVGQMVEVVAAVEAVTSAAPVEAVVVVPVSPDVATSDLAPPSSLAKAPEPEAPR